MMANLPEDPDWVAGIYQIEQTDPVLGGPPNIETGAGMTNIPTQQLAKRTRFLKQVLDDAGIGAEVSPPIADFNAVTQSGLYHAPSAANAPEGGATLTLAHIQGASSDQATQWAQNVSADKAWFRRRVGSTWGSWREVRHSGNTGTAAAADTTNSATDTTAGRLLRLGDWGLGSTSPVSAPNDDLNYAVRNGWFDIAGATANSPLGGQNGVCCVSSRGSGRVHQTAYRIAGGSVPEFYSRVSYSADPLLWSPWTRGVQQQNLLGTVSLSGGVPSGAVFQYGSNANGNFLRFADGTQICWFEIPLGIVTQNGAGTYSDPYRTNFANWTFPVAFSSSGLRVGLAAFAEVTDAQAARILLSASYGGKNSTQLNRVQVFRCNDNSTATVVWANAVVMGRWD